MKTFATSRGGEVALLNDLLAQQIQARGTMGINLPK